jgi:UDP-2-acetamido-3-amino-2,3-dideoxy-glucuronate N-acetyltransferase
MAESTFHVAVIGCGRWGINHLRTAVSSFGNELKYACDVDPEREGKVKEVAPKTTFTTRFQEILDDTSVTAVIIATPAETHYNLTRAFLEAGKHVLVEKPVSLFSYQARELEQIAAKQKRILMVGHVLLFHPAVIKIKEMIREGVLGKMQYIYSNRLNLGTVRKEENILWSFAPHDISLLQYFTEKDPLKIDAKGGIFLQPGIHDVTLTTLTYPDNIMAHIHVSWLHPFKEHRLVVIGNKNMIVFEDSKATDKLVLYPKGIDWVAGEPIKRDEGFQVIDYQDIPPLSAELQHFRECVVKGLTPLTDGRNGTKVLEILEQAQASLEKQDNQAAPVPEASEKSPEANYSVHETAVVDKGCKIGEGTKIWHYSHVQSGATIGEKCSLGQNVNVGNHVKIGNFVKIQNNVSVYEGVELEILNPRSEFPRRGSEFYIKTLVKYGASIGANATIVCGTTIHRFAFVGAGAVVTKDVPEYALVVGNPARIVGWMCRCGSRLDFDRNRAACGKCGREYNKSGNKVMCEGEE